MAISFAFEFALAAGTLLMIVGCPGLCAEHGASIPYLMVAIGVAGPILAWIVAGRLIRQPDAASA